MGIIDTLFHPEKVKEKRYTGTIIHLAPTGFGFISSHDIEFTRIFFHWSALKSDTLNYKELEEGMKVEFTPYKHPIKGWRAIKIKVLSEK